MSKENKTNQTNLNIKEKTIAKNKKYNKKIVVVGSGAFGTSIAESLVRGNKRKNEIVLFGINTREINDINKNHKNSKYFSMKLSTKLVASNKPKETFKDADIILLVIPSAAFKIALKETVVPNLTKPAYFVNLAKGFDYEKKNILCETIKESVPKELNLGILKMAGPSFASEIIQKTPTSFILAGYDKSISDKIYKELLSNEIKIKPTDGIEATEWLSILKNPLAILMGIVAGLGYKANARAMFFTIAINEIKNAIKKLGLDEEHVFGAAGIGDIYLTGTYKKSRNFSTGYSIGKGDKVTKKVLKKFSTVEGLRSIEILLKISKKYKLGLKTINLLYNITYKKEKPSLAIRSYIEKF